MIASRPPSPPRRRGLRVIVLLAALVRLAPLPFVIGVLPKAAAAGIASDGERFYLPLARGLAERGEFALRPGEPSASHAPLYPLVLAGLLPFGMLTPAGIAVLQSFIGVALLVSLYVLVRDLAGDRPAAGAFCLAAMLPDLAVYSYLNLSENLATVLTLAALIVWIRGRDAADLRPALTAGLVLGLAGLTREFSLTLAVPMACWVFLAGPACRPVRSVAALVVGALLVIAPWSARNYVAFKEFIPIAAKLGGNLYLGTLTGDYHPTDARRGLSIDDPRQAEVDRRLREALQQVSKPGARDRLHLRAALANLRDDPLGQAAHLVRKAGFFWQANVGWRHRDRIGLGPALAMAEVGYWLALSAAVVSAFLGKGPARARLLLGLLIAWTFLFHLIVGEAEPRYHFLPLLVACGLAAFSLPPRGPINGPDPAGA